VAWIPAYAGMTTFYDPINFRIAQIYEISGQTWLGLPKNDKVSIIIIQEILFDVSVIDFFKKNKKMTKCQIFQEISHFQDFCQRTLIKNIFIPMHYQNVRAKNFSDFGTLLANSQMIAL
jgi:hypothetical protein